MASSFGIFEVAYELSRAPTVRPIRGRHHFITLAIAMAAEFAEASQKKNGGPERPPADKSTAVSELDLL
jgi:hypothetical protein